MRNALSNVSDIVDLDSERATAANIEVKDPRKVQSPVPPGMKTLKCHISEDTYRKLKACAALDGTRIAQAVEALLLVGLRPVAPPLTIEEQLVRAVPHVDRHLYEKLDVLRVKQGKAWQQFIAQALTLLERQLTGQPISLERPSFDFAGAPSMPPRLRTTTAVNSGSPRKGIPSGFLADVDVIDISDDDTDDSGIRPSRSGR